MKTSLVNYYVFEEIEKERAVLEQFSPEELATYIYDDPKYFNDLKTHLKVSGLTFNLDRHKKNIMFYLVGEYIHQLYEIGRASCRKECRSRESPIHRKNKSRT